MSLQACEQNNVIHVNRVRGWFVTQELITNIVSCLFKRIPLGSRETAGGEQEYEVESRAAVWGGNKLIMTGKKLTDMMVT